MVASVPTHPTRPSRLPSFRAAIAVAALLTSSLFTVGAAGALPSGPPLAASGLRVVTVTCAEVGDLRVVLSAEGTPTPASALPSGMSLRTAYRATSSRTGAKVTGGERGDISCSQVPVHGVRFAALADGPAPVGARDTDLFAGSVAFSLVAKDQLLSTNAVAPPGAGVPFSFAARLRSYLATRSGRVSVAVFDARTAMTYSYNAGARYVTASIVKASVLGTLLRQVRIRHRSLTSTERSLATRMIERSDNAATTTLWNKVGRGPAVRTFMGRVGMASTTPGPGGFWGLTSTNAPDQVRLLRTVAYPNAVLSATSRRYEESLMRAVTPSQRWGVSHGAPADATVALKNGWLPRTGGWVINSIGHIRGGTSDYVIAVLTSGNPSMRYGITTVEHVAAMMRSMRQALSLSAPPTALSGLPFVLSGTGFPARLGRPVVVQRRVGSTWVQVGSTTQSSTGRYSVAISASTPGRVTYRAVTVAFGGSAAMASVSRVVSVHASPPPIPPPPTSTPPA
jgi:beta-lactamase class A